MAEDRTAKHVVAEVLIDGRWVIADPAYRVLLRDAKGFSHNAFKIDLARRVIVRALTQAANGMPQVQSSKKVR